MTVCETALLRYGDGDVGVDAVVEVLLLAWLGAPPRRVGLGTYVAARRARDARQKVALMISAICSTRGTFESL